MGPDLKKCSGWLAAVLCLALWLPAHSQTFPNRPVRLVMAVAGGAEVVARLVAQKLTGSLGQPVVIETQSGAGGSIGAEMVARAAPDGHTILLASASSQVMRVYLSKNMSYDPIRDFTPITRVAEAVLCIVANPAFQGGNSLKDLIEYARRNPGKVSYGTSGIGTTHHLAAELIKQATGVEMVHVPYKGGGQVLTDVIGGQIPIAFSILATATPHVATGKLKILAVVNSNRYRAIPNVPTVHEIIPAFDPPPGWMGFFGPARLPPPVLTRLHDEIVAALNVPEIRSKSDDLGFPVSTTTPEEFSTAIKSDIAMVGKIVKVAGIHPE